MRLALRGCAVSLVLEQTMLLTAQDEQGHRKPDLSFDTAGVDKAIRWAIASTDTPEAVLTAFVLLWHTSKGAAYSKWLSHPAVQR